MQENPMQYQNCPECGMLSFMHDDHDHVFKCTNEECQITMSAEEYEQSTGAPRQSVWAKILKALRLKR